MLRAMKLLSATHPVLRDDCCALVAAMLAHAPPLCPKEDGQRFLDSERASLTGAERGQ